MPLKVKTFENGGVLDVLNGLVWMTKHNAKNNSIDAGLLMQFCSARHLEIKQWLRCQDTNEVYLICRWSVNIYSKHGDKNVTAKPNYSGSAFVTQINKVDIEDL